MKTVWTFELDKRINTFEMPINTRLLHVAFNPAKNVPCLWVEVDTDIMRVERKFILIETGAPINFDDTIERMDYVGTVLIFAGNYVIHVYELIKKG